MPGLHACCKGQRGGGVTESRGDEASTENVRCMVCVTMHGVDQRRDILPLRLCARSAPLLIPGVPFRLLGAYIVTSPSRPLHDAVDISFHGLLVQAIELQALRRRRPRCAQAWDAFDCVEGVDEDSICRVRCVLERRP